MADRSKWTERVVARFENYYGRSPYLSSRDGGGWEARNHDREMLKKISDEMQREDDAVYKERLLWKR